MRAYISTLILMMNVFASAAYGAAAATEPLDTPDVQENTISLGTASGFKLLQSRWGYEYTGAWSPDNMGFILNLSEGNLDVCTSPKVNEKVLVALYEKLQTTASVKGWQTDPYLGKREIHIDFQNYRFFGQDSIFFESHGQLLLDNTFFGSHGHIAFVAKTLRFTSVMASVIPNYTKITIAPPPELFTVIENITFSPRMTPVLIQGELNFETLFFDKEFYRKLFFENFIVSHSDVSVNFRPNLLPRFLAPDFSPKHPLDDDILSAAPAEAPTDMAGSAQDHLDQSERDRTPSPAQTPGHPSEQENQDHNDDEREAIAAVPVAFDEEKAAEEGLPAEAHGHFDYFNGQELEADALRPTEDNQLVPYKEPNLKDEVLLLRSLFREHQIQSAQQLASFQAIASEQATRVASLEDELSSCKSRLSAQIAMQNAQIEILERNRFQQDLRLHRLTHDLKEMRNEMDGVTPPRPKRSSVRVPTVLNSSDISTPVLRSPRASVASKSENLQEE